MGREGGGGCGELGGLGSDFCEGGRERDRVPLLLEFRNTQPHGQGMGLAHWQRPKGT